MIHLPRFAVGTVQPGADHHVMAWALMQALVNHGLRVQPFSAQGRFSLHDASYAITGLRRRYLDSWLMKRSTCVELFAGGSQDADMALLEGTFDLGRGGHSHLQGGSLDCLCDYLTMPKLAIIDATRLATGCVPRLPEHTAGLLLDSVTDTAHLCQLQTTLETLLNVPVLGSLGQLGCLRSLLMSAVHRTVPTGELCAALGRELETRLQLQRILQLASARRFPAVPRASFGLANGRNRKLHVAVALDEAFTCYFPDTLDVLEERGATVSVFSPLRSERLPHGCDVLYFGCGRPEQHAEHLSGNICIKEAIWNHVMSGGRIYAESAGMAYLAREVELPNGTMWPMVGILPSRARLDPSFPVSTPATVTVEGACWLFTRNQRARGYLNRRWCLCDDDGVQTLAAEPEHRLDMVGDYQVVASRLHLHFASQPPLLQRFFQPTERVGLSTMAWE